MLDFFRKLVVRKKPVILEYTFPNMGWTYVELQLPKDSEIVVTAYKQAEYKFFDVGIVRHHVAVSGSQEVGFNTAKEKFSRDILTKPTHMMLEMDRLFQEARQPNVCSILGCSQPASLDVVCVRWEVESDFGTLSAGTPYQVCSLPEHLEETKAKNSKALRYTVTPYCVQTE